jgi:Flp pilus assembly protein TadD
MSIIFKALKKAEEESRVERVSVKKTQFYHFTNKRVLGIIAAVLAGVVGFALVGLFLFQKKPALKTFVKTEAKVTTVQPKTAAESVKKKEPPVAAASDTAKAREDAIKHIRDKKYSDAEDILRKAILAKPDDAMMHNHLGIALRNQGKYKDAAKAYEKALKLKPDYYEAMNNLAVTKEILGDKKKAEFFYKKALSLKPSYAEAHLNYALLLETEGDSPAAESHYQTFINLSSDEALKNKVKERLKGLKK